MSYTEAVLTTEFSTTSEDALPSRPSTSAEGYDFHRPGGLRDEPSQEDPD